MKAYFAHPWTRVFLITFVLMFASSLLWAAATPMYGVPDEPAHMIRAAGAARGNLSGTDPGDGTYPRFEVPAILDSHPCYAHDPWVTADCMVFPPRGGTVVKNSSAASYPPLGHLLVGWPLLVTDGLGGLYLMRAANAAIASILIGVGVATMARVRLSQSTAVGVALGLTPMSMLLIGAVSPNGLAIAAGFATWAGALALVRRQADSVRRTHISLLMGPFCFLLLLRRDSLIWGAAIGICVLLFLPMAHYRRLAKDWATWVWASAAAVAAFLQLFVWGGPGGEGLVDAAGSSDGSASLAFARIPQYIEEAIGVLGWLDTVLPSAVYVLWVSLVVGIVVYSTTAAIPRMMVSLTAAVMLFITLPTVIGSFRYPYLQGRYLLPFAIGLPLLATAALRGTRGSVLNSLRSAGVVLGILWFLQVLAFAYGLRRYSVGIGEPWSAMRHPAWEPPTAPILVLVLGFSVIYATFLAWLALVFSTRAPRWATDLRPRSVETPHHLPPQRVTTDGGILGVPEALAGNDRSEGSSVTDGVTAPHHGLGSRSD